ncbi:MAG: (Fe-S)-binding protein [Candidatus Jordarchaeales archaeon]
MSNKNTGGKGSFINLLIPPRVREVKITEVLPCLAAEDRIRVVGNTGEKLSDLLPVIYLYLPQATYSRESDSVSFMFEEHLITVFGEGKITATNLKDKDEAIRTLNYVKDLLNRAAIYVSRHGVPSLELMSSKPKVNPIEINKALPKKDCGKCGVSTCYGFAVKLALGECKPSMCPYLDANSQKELQKKIHFIQI